MAIRLKGFDFYLFVLFFGFFFVLIYFFYLFSFHFWKQSIFGMEKYLKPWISCLPE